MKIEFKYNDLRCNLVLDDSNGYDVNPIPIVNALSNLFTAISCCNNVLLTIETVENENEIQT